MAISRYFGSINDLDLDPYHIIFTNCVITTARKLGTIRNFCIDTKIIKNGQLTAERGILIYFVSLNDLDLYPYHSIMTSNHLLVIANRSSIARNPFLDTNIIKIGWLVAEIWHLIFCQVPMAAILEMTPQMTPKLSINKNFLIFGLDNQ